MRLKVYADANIDFSFHLPPNVQPTLQGVLYTDAPTLNGTAVSPYDTEKDMLSPDPRSVFGNVEEFESIKFELYFNAGESFARIPLLGR